MVTQCPISKWFSQDEFLGFEVLSFQMIYYFKMITKIFDRQKDNEKMCPQLSKPKATAARNQNSLCDRMENKKTLGETGSNEAVIVHELPFWCKLFIRLIINII